MFVKKDLRKIPQIFADAMTSSPSSNTDEVQPCLTELKLARRPAEFNGSISVLCNPSYIPTLHNLTSLTLYDCQISSLDGIDFFASSPPLVEAHNIKDDENESKSHDLITCPHLSKLNLGHNPLRTLPTELSLLRNSLTDLWLDDCQLEGPLPTCLYQLHNLQVLRLSNNRIQSLKGGKGGDGDEKERNYGVANWTSLKVLCLDGNQIEDIPYEFIHLRNLESLLLRKNKLQSLPEGVPGQTHAKLSLLHISSNQITTLPQSIVECTSLKTLYTNSNDLKSIPENFAQNLKDLELCNFSNNQIETLPNDFIDRFGIPDLKSGQCGKDSACTVHLDQNPVVKILQPTDDINME